VALLAAQVQETLFQPPAPQILIGFVESAVLKTAKPPAVSRRGFSIYQSTVERRTLRGLAAAYMSGIRQ